MRRQKDKYQQQLIQQLNQHLHSLDFQVDLLRTDRDVHWVINQLSHKHP